jgi:hypothetical protein
MRKVFGSPHFLLCWSSTGNKILQLQWNFVNKDMPPSRATVVEEGVWLASTQGVHHMAHHMSNNTRFGAAVNIPVGGSEKLQQQARLRKVFGSPQPNFMQLDAPIYPSKGFQ